MSPCDTPNNLKDPSRQKRNGSRRLSAQCSQAKVDDLLPLPRRTCMRPCPKWLAHSFISITLEVFLRSSGSPTSRRETTFCDHGEHFCVPCRVYLGVRIILPILSGANYVYPWYRCGFRVGILEKGAGLQKPAYSPLFASSLS